ncbi:sec-independent protein translocase protein TatA [Streptosporangium becharense]|uniref:Sec-independent protein translocase protein TatA n=1 Tax=Streptosporangium becharense TaxID=1816182 RepID=A0A7W9MEI2_9ACTN|nr:Sec-independent protein translocase subunit TatA [Streptosporangium becharense]MBB2913729.1 sec-independent protein translocase protein TatA [Streptosporangium becharense]MBB5817810.1 sec-independent protein translocase protein TatA [Streptosporangium becharense]
MPNLGPTELIIIGLILVLLFGAKKLPEAARGLGRSLRIFKAETSKLRDEDDAESTTATVVQAQPQPAAPAPQPLASASTPAPAAAPAPSAEEQARVLEEQAARLRAQAGAAKQQ